MITTLRPTEFLIGDHNGHLFAAPTINGENKAKGLVPRNYSTHPHCYAANAVPFEALNMPLTPRNEWIERCREMAANKSRISDIRRTSGPNGGHIPSLDQNGQGYCWMYSGTMAVMLVRAIMNQPYVRLSAHAGACMVKNFRDEGGWGALGLQWLTEKGQPSVEMWPEKSMSRSNDRPEVWANALLHRVSESWVDLSPPVYSRNLTEDQAMTCLFNRCPLIGDFNHWGHSVCLMDPVLVSELATNDLGSLDFNNPDDLAIYAAAFGKRGINSWTDGWGDLGEFTLTGSKAILDGGAAIRAVRPS